VTELRAGTRLRSTTSTTVVLVTRGDSGVLTCGGQPMVPAEDIQAPPASPGHDLSSQPADDTGETILGKRYHSPDGTLQVLCIQQGAGTLAINGTALELIKPKLLPSSD
jgi:hypothetical protein